MNSQIEQIYNAEGDDAEIVPATMDNEIWYFNASGKKVFEVWAGDWDKEYFIENAIYTYHKDGGAPQRMNICGVNCRLVGFSGKEMVYKTGQGDKVIVAVSDEGFFIAG